MTNAAWHQMKQQNVKNVKTTALTLESTTLEKCQNVKNVKTTRKNSNDVPSF